jgi:hypothetical protein
MEEKRSSPNAISIIIKSDNLYLVYVAVKAATGRKRERRKKKEPCNMKPSVVLSKT